MQREAQRGCSGKWMLRAEPQGLWPSGTHGEPEKTQAMQNEIQKQSSSAKIQGVFSCGPVLPRDGGEFDKFEAG